MVTAGIGSTTHLWPSSWLSFLISRKYRSLILLFVAFFSLSVLIFLFLRPVCICDRYRCRVHLSVRGRSAFGPLQTGQRLRPLWEEVPSILLRDEWQIHQQWTDSGGKNKHPHDTSSSGTKVDKNLDEKTSFLNFQCSLLVTENKNLGPSSLAGELPPLSRQSVPPIPPASLPATVSPSIPSCWRAERAHLTKPTSQLR